MGMDMVYALRHTIIVKNGNRIRNLSSIAITLAAKRFLDYLQCRS